MTSTYISGSKQVVLVNPAGEIIGHQDVLDAHRHPAQLHLAISVFLVTKHQHTGEIITLLQQRSNQKIVGANQWGNTVCGNVAPGETVIECAERRLRQELGIQDNHLPKLKLAYQFEYQVFTNEVFGEHELDSVYLGGGGEPPDFKLNPNEVSASCWVPVQKLIAAAAQLTYPSVAETLHQPSQNLMNKTSAANFTVPCYQSPNDSSAENLSLTLVPWTILILRDPRLSAAITSQTS